MHHRYLERLVERDPSLAGFQFGAEIASFDINTKRLVIDPACDPAFARKHAHEVSICFFEKTNELGIIEIRHVGALKASFIRVIHCGKDIALAVEQANAIQQSINVSSQRTQPFHFTNGQLNDALIRHFTNVRMPSIKQEQERIARRAGIIWAEDAGFRISAPVQPQELL